MTKYTPSDINDDIEYQTKKSNAYSQTSPYDRAVALLNMRKEYAGQVNELLEQKNHFHDEFMDRMLVGNILSDPNPEHSQNDIQFYEDENERYRQLAETGKDISLKVAYLHSTADLEYIKSIAQKVVDLAHKATLERYNNNISPLENVKNAHGWIAKKEHEVKKMAAKNDAATLG